MLGRVVGQCIRRDYIGKPLYREAPISVFLYYTELSVLLYKYGTLYSSLAVYREEWWGRVSAGTISGSPYISVFIPVALSLHTGKSVGEGYLHIGKPSYIRIPLYSSLAVFREEPCISVFLYRELLISFWDAEGFFFEDT